MSQATPASRPAPAMRMIASPVPDSPSPELLALEDVVVVVGADGRLGADGGSGVNGFACPAALEARSRNSPTTVAITLMRGSTARGYAKAGRLTAEQANAGVHCRADGQAPTDTRGAAWRHGGDVAPGDPV